MYKQSETLRPVFLVEIRTKSLCPYRSSGLITSIFSHIRRHDDAIACEPFASEYLDEFGNDSDCFPTTLALIWLTIRPTDFQYEPRFNRRRERFEESFDGKESFSEISIVAVPECDGLMCVRWDPR